MALAGNPKLLVLDEPTTGLDATVEAEVLDLVRDLRRETGCRDPADRPQHGRHPHDVRPRRRDVRRPHRRGGHRRRGVRPAEPPVHDGSAQLDPASRRAQDRSVAVHDPRQPAADRRRPAHVRVRRSVPARRRAVPSTRSHPSSPSRSGHWTRCHHSDAIDRSAPDRAREQRLRHRHRDHRAARRRVEDVPPARLRRPGAGQHRPRVQGGRDARPRRRVGFREVDPGQDAARHPRARRRRNDRARRQARQRRRPPTGKSTRSARSRWCSRTPTRR